MLGDVAGKQIRVAGGKNELSHSWIVGISARHLASVDLQHSRGTETRRTVIGRLRDLSNDFKKSELPRRKVMSVLVFSMAWLAGT